MNPAQRDARLAELEAQLASLDAVNQVLMERVESAVDTSAGAFALFERNILLEQHISERTSAIEASNRQLLQEIAERVRAERELARLKTAVEQAAEGILITDTSGAVEYASPSFLRMTGYPLGEVLGKATTTFWAGQSVERSGESKRNTLGEGNVWSGRVKCVRKDGSEFHLEEVVSPVRNLDGEIIDYVCVARDVTREMALESQLRHAQKLESIGQLAAGIAHEINTPTQFVGDNTRFLRDAVADLVELVTAYGKLAAAIREENKCREWIHEVEEIQKRIDLDFLIEELPRSIEQTLEGIARVTLIVRAMKEFSHPGVATPTPTDLNSCIESTVTVARSEWKYVADLNVAFDPALPLVPCIPADFNQVILNLVVNSAQAITQKFGTSSGQKGCIRITTARKDGHAEVEIEDNGCGIPEAIRHRVFDPFFTTKEVGKGTGQGLAIARNVVVDKLGGTIECRSEPGSSTTFTIRLPLQCSILSLDEDPDTVR